MKTLILLLLTIFFSFAVPAQKSTLAGQPVLPLPVSALAKANADQDCNTWTYQVRLSSTAGERPTDAVHLPDNNYIVSGSDTSQAGVRGRLIKLNSQGTVLYSKAFAQPGQEITFQRLRFFSDGNLYVLGASFRASTLEINPFLLCVDTATLSVISILQLEGAGQKAWKAFDFAEGRDNHVFVLASNNALLNVTKINYKSNSIQWSKSFRPSNSPRPVGIGVEYQDVYVAWNEDEQGYTKAMMMSLDNLTGKYRYGSATGGRAESRSIEMQCMTMVNLRPRITALQRKDNSFQAVRVNYEATAFPTFREEFAITGFTPLAGMRSQQIEWGQTLAYQAGTATDNISLVQTYVDNYNTPIRSWLLKYADPVLLNRLIYTNDGGNLVVSRTATYPERIVLSKTDSIATLPGCSLSPRPAIVKNVTMDYTMVTVPEETSVFQLAALSLSVAEVGVTVSEECKTLYCPSPPQPDSCLRTFFKEYRNSTNSIVAGEMISIGEGKFLLQSRARGTPYVAVEQTQLTVMDTAGRVLESRMLGSNKSIVLLTFNKLRDGNLLGTGYINNGDQPSDIYLFKFNQQFTIFWQKKLVTTAAPHFNAITAILESKEGDFYCHLVDRITSPLETRTLLKLDADGNPIWMKQYSIGPTIFPQSGEHVPALVEVDDAVILKYNDEDSDFSPYLMRIKKSDGSPVWVRKYQMPGPYGGSGSYSLRGLVTDGSFLYMSGISQERNVLLKIRLDGSVALARRSAPSSAYLGWLGLKANGRLLTSVGGFTPGGHVNGVAEMDTNFTMLRTQFMKVPRGGRNGSLVPFSDSVTYAAGSLWYDNHYWSSLYFQKYNFNSTFASCAVNEQLVVLESFQQPVTEKQVGHANLTPPQMVPHDARFEKGHLAYSGYYCGNNTACSDLDLQGPALICDSTTVYSYRVKLNEDCRGMVLWRMDTTAGQVKVLLESDSLLQLQVRSSGTFKLRTRVFANCGWLEDSTVVEATIRGATLNLGRDTSVCPGNTLVLHAGAGFASYRWQDGSTDSIFVARQPGLYIVQVTSCGTVFKDSVLITAAPPVSLDLGPDRTKCNEDTVRLTAPPGFLNYSWGSAYNISSLTGPSVVVNPRVDTTYHVKAEKTPGCFAHDTVRITVSRSPAIELGRDTSFCQGDSLVLNAGTGFQTYTWNDGSKGPTLMVRSKGAYSVSAVTQQGCRSLDTLRVLQVHALPVVELANRPALCLGESVTFDAGSFSTYLWQNGTTGKTLTTRDTGFYFVHVSDANGCRGGDTTLINTIHPLPKAFLPADTAICSYGSLELKSLNQYRSYLWSTGGTTPGITITQPGFYWLQVQDNNNCSGRDSVLVSSKECLSGFYVPTAFSPNGDGKNDVFRPLLFGRVKQYRFTIYNRWGEVVFQTSELQKGWNGKVTGIQQETSTFVWTCTYQLEGEAVKNAKGTVMLIR